MSEPDVCYVVHFFYNNFQMNFPFPSLKEFNDYQCVTVSKMSLKSSRFDITIMELQLNGIYREIEAFIKSKGPNFMKEIKIKKIWEPEILKTKQLVWSRNIICLTRKGSLDRSICHFTDRLSPDIQLCYALRDYCCDLLNQCPVCHEKATKHCPDCRQGYCGEDHQLAHWRVHKISEIHCEKRQLY